MNTFDVILSIAQVEREGDDALVYGMVLGVEFLGAPDTNHEHDGKGEDDRAKRDEEFCRYAQSHGDGGHGVKVRCK